MNSSELDREPLLREQDKWRYLNEGLTRVLFSQKELRRYVGTLLVLYSHTRGVLFPFLLRKSNSLEISIRFSQNANSHLLPTKKRESLTSVLKTDLVTGNPRHRNYNVYLNIRDLTYIGRYLQAGLSYLDRFLTFQLLSPQDILKTLEELCTGRETSLVDTFALWSSEGTFFPYCVLTSVSFDQFLNLGKFSHASGSLSVKEIEPYRAVEIL